MLSFLFFIVTLLSSQIFYEALNIRYNMVRKILFTNIYDKSFRVEISPVAKTKKLFALTTDGTKSSEETLSLVGFMDPTALSFLKTIREYGKINGIVVVSTLVFINLFILFYRQRSYGKTGRRSVRKNGRLSMCSRRVTLHRSNCSM